MYERILTTIDYINMKTREFRPEIGIVLGSGLGGLVEGITVQHSIPYKDIPNFPVSTVKGHNGELLLAPLQGGASWLCKVGSIFMKAIR